MVDKVSMIRNAFEYEFESYLSREIVGYVASEGGTMDSNLSWSIEETPYNTYSFQPQTPETVPGYRKKDGSYVDSYQRKATPIKAPIETNPAGLASAIDRAIGTFTGNLQSRV